MLRDIFTLVFVFFAENLFDLSNEYIIFWSSWLESSCINLLLKMYFFLMVQ